MDFPRRRSADAGVAGLPAPRRVFTAPVSSAPRSPSPANRPAADGLVETLYNHPSVKIVAFTAGPQQISVVPGREIEPGSLSWSSQLERTIAVGPFRIYRAPGSVAFLSCGSALQPILPKSQCWCVDEESSKFVLQVRRPQYWRMEVPVADDEDVHRSQLLRAVLDRILQFEKTECPFKRTFTVVLPQRPQTPVKKRPWTPVRKPVVTLPPTPVTPSEAKFLAKKTPGPEEKPVPANTDGPQDSMEGASSEMFRAVLDPPREEASPRRDRPEASPFETNREENDNDADNLPLQVEKTRRVSRQAKPCNSQAARSSTVPPRLSLAASPPSKSVTEESCSIPASAESGSQSPTGSQDSFHSVEAWHSPLTPLPPSPPMSDPDSPMTFPYPHDNIVLPKKPAPQGTSPDSTHPDTLEAWFVSPTSATNANSFSAPPSLREVEINPPGSAKAAEGLHANTSAAEDTPDQAASSTETTTRRPQIRHRPTTSSSISPNRRALSPLPPAANLFTPRQPFALTAMNSGNDDSNSSNSSISSIGKLAVVRQLPQLPMAVIHKTCEILLAPPQHLLQLMLKVAARIAAGQWRGFVFGTGEGGERIPVRWDWSDGDDDGDGELGGWGADDDWPTAAAATASSNQSSATASSASKTSSSMPRERCNGEHSPQQRRRRGKKTRKMAGSFPSDDDEEDEDGQARGKERHSEEGRQAAGRRGGQPDDPQADADWAGSWGVD